jgi:Patatin-like phospholipase
MTSRRYLPSTFNFRYEIRTERGNKYAGLLTTINKLGTMLGYQNSMFPKHIKRSKSIICLSVLGYLFVSIVILQGCATTQVRSPLPSNLEGQVEVSGFPNVRSWADAPSKALNESAVESIRQEIAAYGVDTLKKPAEYLILSGGGQNGAFGAGVLCGWTAAGNRPTFKLVTGISTGSLIAPFAFLGPEYDSELKTVYTTITDNDILQEKSILTAYWRQSVYGTKPLADLIAKHIDEKLLAAVATEHKKGRRLLVGTTQLDAQRLVIWDMGAIAVSGNPEALDLFRKILLASASMPAFFPPVYITVTAGGTQYDEMHADGGTTTEQILYENALMPLTQHKKGLKSVLNEKAMSALEHRKRIAYIIRNDRTTPEWESVKPRLGNIAGRAISTLVKTHGDGDLYRIYVLALRDEIDYNLASIPIDFNAPSEGMFDPEFMQKLFNVGYEMARHGYPWQKYPPGYEPEAASSASNSQ